MTSSTIYIHFLQKEKLHKAAVYKIIEHNNFLYTTGADGFVLKWTKDLSHCELICKTNVANYTLAIFKNNLCIGSSNGMLTIINLEKKELVLQTNSFKKGIFALQEWQNQLFIGTETGNLICLNDQFEHVGQQKVSEKSLRVITTTENHLFIGSSDTAIYRLNLQLEIDEMHDYHQNSVFAIAVKDNQLFSGGRDSKLIANALETSTIKKIDAHVSTINAIEFSPKQNFVVTASRDKSFRVWCATTLKLLKVMNREKETRMSPFSINSILWLEDKLYSADDSGAVICWQFAKI